jgi:hypothetical protein
MRIINISSNPRYFSYASKAGKLLAPNDSSNELPFIVIHNSLLWADLKAGNVRLTLSQADRDFIGNVLREDAKTPVVTVSQVPAKLLTSREKRQQAAREERLAREAMEAKKAASLQHLKRNVGGATGQPQFGKDEAGAPVIPVVTPGKTVSLEQLKQHNKGVQVKQAEVPKNIPINPRGGVLGQPIFSPGPGPGTENRGVGRATEATQERIKQGRGGRV